MSSSWIAGRAVIKSKKGLQAIVILITIVMKSFMLEAAAQPASQTLSDQIVANAIEQTQGAVTYDSTYTRIPYPMGDVPKNRGVCSDVVVRAYRAAGIDLQQEVHEDMRQHFASYPQTWKLRGPDSNIDHRRVPNLMTFFQRRGAGLRISNSASEYRAGDLVAWDLGGGVTHIGILVPAANGGQRPSVVHNIGAGPKLEDVLFSWKIIGHYRYGMD